MIIQTEEQSNGREVLSVKQGTIDTAIDQSDGRAANSGSVPWKSEIPHVLQGEYRRDYDHKTNNDVYHTVTCKNYIYVLIRSVTPRHLSARMRGWEGFYFVGRICQINGDTQVDKYKGSRRQSCQVPF